MKKKILISGEFVNDQPKKRIQIKSKYPSTMSDSLFEHILTLLNPKF